MFTFAELAGLQVTSHFNVAGTAILIYDYAITFEDEVRLVWGRGWDTIRFFFTVSRYLPFAGVAMTTYSVLQPSGKPCASVPKKVENVLHILGIIAAEMLLIFRTYAFWQCNKRLLYGLLAYAFITIAVAVAFNVAPILPKRNTPPSCLVASRNATFAYLPLLLFEAVVLFLTAFKYFQAYRDMRTQIVRTIYWDGVFYILCILLITLANVIVDGAFPFQFSDLFDIPQITLHSVLASRIMFNLRRTSYDTERESMQIMTISDISYHTPGRSLSTIEWSGTRSRDLATACAEGDVELTRLERRKDTSSIRHSRT